MPPLSEPEALVWLVVLAELAYPELPDGELLDAEVPREPGLVFALLDDDGDELLLEPFISEEPLVLADEELSLLFVLELL